MSDWQPIETAPTDGTPFLAFCPSDKPTVVALQCASGREGGGWECWSFCDEALADIAPEGADPTHWMPLPAAPKEAA